MVSIIFISTNGDRRCVEAPEGSSLMQAAISNDVPEIEAACGGSLSCGTCHVYIGDDWIERIPGPKSMERDMLDCGVYVQANSRLACQIIVTEALDGMVVATPPSQY